MRVVSGELRGRPLWAPPGTDVRPTSDRAREAVFSILGQVGGARVLDLFCGTGALAIEALSRGAEHAVLVDVDVSAAQRNISDLTLGDRAIAMRTDVVDYLSGEGGERFDLIFCDPPYKLADPLEAELDRLLPAWLAAGGRVIVESAARWPLRLSLPVLRERTYGEAAIHVYGETAA